MTDAMRAHVLAAALGTPKRGKLCADDITPEPPSLQDEHGHARRNISVMHQVIDRANASIGPGSEELSKQWSKLTPQMVTVASWVGYDLDGRRDIQWSDTIRLKLGEKVAKRDYCAQGEAIAAARKNRPKGWLMPPFKRKKRWPLHKPNKRPLNKIWRLMKIYAAAAGADHGASQPMGRYGARIKMPQCSHPTSIAEQGQAPASGLACAYKTLRPWHGACICG